MIETNQQSKHIAGIIPIAGLPLEFNMPWHDCLMPIGADYHAIERAVHGVAMAGCDTIWIICHRETQPILRKKIGEWVYDPESVWKGPNTFFNKKEIPVYYVAINPRDRKRRDSLAWSSLYGANVASYISKKISRWVVPKRFFIMTPYGILDEEVIKNSRELLRGTSNITFRHGKKTFLDNEYLPFTFSEDEYKICKKEFKERYTGDETKKTFNDIYSPINISTYSFIDVNKYYNISTWDGYRKFLGSPDSLTCTRPKYMVTHSWHGFIKDK